MQVNPMCSCLEGHVGHRYRDSGRRPCFGTRGLWHLPITLKQTGQRKGSVRVVITQIYKNEILVEDAL